MSKLYTMPWLPSDLLTSEVIDERRLKTESPLDNIIEVSDRGSVGLPVYIQDQTTDVLTVRMLNRLGNFTLATDAVADSFTFIASTGHGIVTGNLIELASPINFIQARVLNVAGDVITIDTPINGSYTVADTTGIKSSDDLRVDGSVTPQIFTIKPEPDQSGDITAVILSIRTNAAQDFSKFGAGNALTRGCTIRKKRPDGQYVNLINFKSNGDFIAQSFNHYFQEKAGGGDYGFVSEIRYAGQENYGVAIRLEGVLDEELQFVVSDNLTSAGLGLTSLKMFARGSTLQE